MERYVKIVNLLRKKHYKQDLEIIPLTIKEWRLKMPVFRFCKKCDERFQPIGKFNYVCDDCKFDKLRAAWKKRLLTPKLKKKVDSRAVSVRKRGISR